MTDRQLLEKHGWREHSRKRYGCVLRVWWFNSRDGEVLPQGYIANVIRNAQKAQAALAATRKEQP